MTGGQRVPAVFGSGTCSALCSAHDLVMALVVQDDTRVPGPGRWCKSLWLFAGGGRVDSTIVHTASAVCVSPSHVWLCSLLLGSGGSTPCVCLLTCLRACLGHLPLLALTVAHVERFWTSCLMLSSALSILRDAEARRVSAKHCSQRGVSARLPLWFFRVHSPCCHLCALRLRA